MNLEYLNHESTAKAVRFIEHYASPDVIKEAKHYDKFVSQLSSMKRWLELTIGMPYKAISEYVLSKNLALTR